eukprot:5726450-Alexandrium_andersonii.AAC.1
MPKEASRAPKRPGPATHLPSGAKRRRARRRSSAHTSRATVRPGPIGPARGGEPLPRTWWSK